MPATEANAPAPMAIPERSPIAPFFLPVPLAEAAPSVRGLMGEPALLQDWTNSGWEQVS